MNLNLISKLNFSLTKKLPMIRQGENSECGLACLAMISSYWGYETNIIGIRQKFPVSSRGMNMAQMIDLADSMQFDSRALQLELFEIGELQTPCILHWDLNHFVVLKSVRADKMTIHDPAVGIRTLTKEQVSKSFTGIALELTPKATFKKKVEKPTLSLKDFWSSLRGIKSSLALLFTISIVVQILSLLMPLLNRFIIDDVILHRDYDFLFVLCMGFGLMNIFSTACSVIRSLFLLYISKTLSLQVSNSLFSHLIRLPMSFFIKRHTGDIMSRFGSLGAIQSMVTTTFVESILDGVLALCTFAMMMLYSPKLALITIVTLALYIALRLITLPYLREMSEQALNAESQERSSFIETLHSMQPIKMFHKEQDRQQIWQTKLTDAFNVQIRNEQLSLSFSVMNKVLFSLENILVLYCCAHLIMSPQSVFSVGMMYAYLQYKSQFSGAVGGLVDNMIQFKMISLHLERIADIALTEKDRGFQQNDEKKYKPDFKGEIELKNLAFRYDQSEPYIFENINLKIEPGQSIGLIGPSGCGKTTLMKVMIGLLEKSDGEILIDGHEIEQLNLHHYRTKIASVMQNDSLLSGSIYENITFFDPHAREEDVYKCAQLAQIHQDILALPMGYQTLCGELGSQLSGGQTQRIMIARALYARPKILFLDEATSHLDILSEKGVSQAIAHLKITRLIIAHRPETIQTCDRIIVVGKDGCQEVTQQRSEHVQKAEKQHQKSENLSVHPSKLPEEDEVLS